MTKTERYQLRIVHLVDKYKGERIKNFQSILIVYRHLMTCNKTHSIVNGKKITCRDL
jgi:hypothetical protein